MANERRSAPHRGMRSRARGWDPQVVASRIVLMGVILLLFAAAYLMVR